MTTFNNTVMEDAQRIITYATYYSEYKQFVERAREIDNKAGYKERITDDDIKWLGEVNGIIRRNNAIKDDNWENEPCNNKPWIEKEGFTEEVHTNTPASAEVEPKQKRGEIVVKEENRGKLTDLQIAFITNMDKDNYFEHGMDSVLWAQVYADTLQMEGIMNAMQTGAMITTLRQKDLIYVNFGTPNGKKSSKYKYFGLTDAGKVLAATLRPDWAVEEDNKPLDEEKPEYAVGDIVRYMGADKRAKFTITDIERNVIQSYSADGGVIFMYTIKGNKGKFIVNESQIWGA